MTGGDKPVGLAARVWRGLGNILTTVFVLLPVIGVPLLMGYFSFREQVVERRELEVVVGVEVYREPLPSGVGSPVWVVETDQAYYPLLSPLVIEKGAKVVLATTRSGKQRVCDQAEQACARTADVGLRVRREKPSPAGG